MKNRILRKVVEFMPILLIIGLLVTLVYCVFYIRKLEDQIYERDKTIQELSFRSNLVEEYFDIKHDSVEHTTSYSLKSSKASHVVIQHDSTIVSTEVLFYRGEEQLSSQEFVKEYNELAKKYNDLYEEYDKLAKRYNNLADEYNNNMHRIKEMEAALSLIEKGYGINYIVRRDSTFSVTTLSNTERVDSALLLLPYYRDKLKKVSEGVWTIEYIEIK